jgi:hypothetical protein
VLAVVDFPSWAKREAGHAGRTLRHSVQSLDDMTYEHFLELVETSFSLSELEGASLGLSLKLAKVTQQDAASRGFPVEPGQEFECLSLIFEGPVDKPIAQGTYQMETVTGSRFLLFLAPLQPSATVRPYQAVINRLRPLKPS